MNKILVTISGILGMAFTYWFFLEKKGKETVVVDSVLVIVEGGYSPETISIPNEKTTRINFIRKDSSVCLEEVVLPEFKIRKPLPLNEKVTVEVTPKKAGTYSISCGMNMYHGKIVVRQSSPQVVKG